MHASASSHSVEALYSDHHRWLRRWLNTRLGDTHQAADLTQDTFVQLLTRVDTLAILEPRAFLTTVAQRVLANHWRRQKLEQAYLDALTALPPDMALSTEDQVLLLQTLVEIDRRLDGLPLLVKRTFLLTRLDGLKHSEVAEALDVSIATVKRYLAQAAEQCYFADEALADA